MKKNPTSPSSFGYGGPWDPPLLESATWRQFSSDKWRTFEADPSLGPSTVVRLQSTASGSDKEYCKDSQVINQIVYRKALSSKSVRSEFTGTSR